MRMNRVGAVGWCSHHGSSEGTPRAALATGWASTSWVDKLPQGGEGASTKRVEEVEMVVGPPCCLPNRPGRGSARPVLESWVPRCQNAGSSVGVGIGKMEMRWQWWGPLPGAGLGITYSEGNTKRRPTIRSSPASRVCSCHHGGQAPHIRRGG